MRKIFFTALVTGIMLSTVPLPCRAQGITVAAAANLQYAITDICAAFEKDTSIKTKLILGSSGKLTAQIENGAPFDVFLSADMDFPQRLADEGLSSVPQVYAYGTLILWGMDKNLKLDPGLSILEKKGFGKIAIANPQLAPYGRKAIDALKSTGIYSRISGKLVYGQSVSQVNQYIIANAVTAGFTSKSAVMGPDTINKGTWVEIDKTTYSPIAQGAVILKEAEKNNEKNAKLFYDFLSSAKAREILTNYGYTLP